LYFEIHLQEKLATVTTMAFSIYTLLIRHCVVSLRNAQDLNDA